MAGRILCTFRKAIRGVGHGLTRSCRIVKSEVHSEPVVLVIAPAQGPEGLAEDVVNQGVARLLSVRGTPSGGRGGEALGVGDNSLGLGVQVGASFQGEGVVVHGQNHVGVEGQVRWSGCREIGLGCIATMFPASK